MFFDAVQEVAIYISQKVGSARASPSFYAIKKCPWERNLEVSG